MPQKKTANNTCTLDVLQEGQRAIVSGVCCRNPALCKKLLSMGLVEGAQIERICCAPLGDPIQFKTRGYKLSLRCLEARDVEVTPLEK
ncbi:MAG: ferrous iron transport protein A [Oligoflexia bacterium]|nr:ferrous iron transport protein A [Oligoflexia bacterium]